MCICYNGCERLSGRIVRCVPSNNCSAKGFQKMSFCLTTICNQLSGGGFEFFVGQSYFTEYKGKLTTYVS